MQRMARLLVAPAALVLILASLTSAASVDATDGWKSIRSDDGDRIRWHSCTVTYSVDMNGYPSSRRKAINEAIRSTERESGVDFVRVPSRKADLKIVLSHKRDGKVIASTVPWELGDEYTKATVTVRPIAFRYSYSDQVDNYRHEFGHVLGLDHVRGSDIMSSHATSNPTRSGWRAGLRWLYQDCR